MEGEDRKDLWRELVTVCGGSKDSVCKFRFSIMILMIMGEARTLFANSGFPTCSQVLVIVIMMI